MSGEILKKKKRFCGFIAILATWILLCLPSKCIWNAIIFHHLHHTGTMSSTYSASHSLPSWSIHTPNRIPEALYLIPSHLLRDITPANLTVISYILTSISFLYRIFHINLWRCCYFYRIEKLLDFTPYVSYCIFFTFSISQDSPE